MDAVDVLTPRTLDEALALKAEHPDAMPIQGGTDVMVALNFDHARPAAILNLNEVAELGAWGRENGALRLGAGVTYAEIEHGELRASFGSASPRPVLVSSPRDEADSFAERVAGAASPIDDVRGSEHYRRHALRVLTERALKRVLV